MTAAPSPVGAGDRTHLLVAVAVTLFLALLVGVGLWVSPELRGELYIVSELLLRGDPDPLRLWLLEFGALAPLLSLVLYLLSGLIPVFPGFVLAIANAMLFGAVWGGLLSFLSAAAASALCFGIARAIGRPGVVRIVSKESLARMDAFMERRGVAAIFLGRLLPFINPDILSYAAGVTGIRWLPFLGAMAAGALPATLFYTLVGALALDAAPWVVAMVSVATLLPLVVLWIFRDRLFPKGTRS